MWHERRWCVSEVDSPEDLAQMLTQQTWTLCSGFVVRGHPEYLFLNDATSEDGAAEYGVIKGGFRTTERLQIESMTFSWMTFEQALAIICSVLNGTYDDASYARRIKVIVQTPVGHRWCHHCR